MITILAILAANAVNLTICILLIGLGLRPNLAAILTNILLPFLAIQFYMLWS